MTLWSFLVPMYQEDFHAAVAWRAFARHAWVTAFFGIAAWALDIKIALSYAIVLWIVLRLVRRPLWGLGIHHTHLWNWVFFARLLWFRWPITILCTFVFWWRSPSLFYRVWPWFVGLFLFDLLSTLLNETRGHRQARMMMQEEEQERERLHNSQ